MVQLKHREEVNIRRVKVRARLKKKKPTAHEIVKLIIEVVIALAALITAIKWW